MTMQDSMTNDANDQKPGHETSNVADSRSDLYTDLEKEDDRDEFFVGSDAEAGSDPDASDADEVEETAAEKRLRVGEQQPASPISS